MKELELKAHACAFAEWKKEKEFIETFELQRAYKKAGGIFSTIGPTISELYDEWMNRSVMTFEEAMEQLKQGLSVTRPRLWSVSRGQLKMKNGIVYAYGEYCPTGMPYKPEYSYADDKTARDWMLVNT